MTQRDAVNDIKAGEAFEEVAKRSSDGATASSGGDLGTVADDQISPTDLREQVKKTQDRAGERRRFRQRRNTGFNILKLVDDPNLGQLERYDKMKKEEIRGQLTATEYQHQIQLWLERQRQTAFIHRAGESGTAGLPVAPATTQ